jgi:gas vesicle protein
MAKFGSFLTGFIAGAAVGLLFAPRKGSEIRDILSRPLEDIKEKADDLAGMNSQKVNSPAAAAKEKLLKNKTAEDIQNL